MGMVRNTLWARRWPVEAGAGNRLQPGPGPRGPGAGPLPKVGSVPTAGAAADAAFSISGVALLFGMDDAFVPVV